MKTNPWKAALASLTLTLACGGGSGVKYFVVGASQYSVPQGTNCGGLSNGTCTLALGGFGTCAETTTIEQQGAWAIYPGAAGQAFLVGALPSSTVLVGSQSGSGYTFAGKVVTSDTTGTTTATDEKDVTVTLTLAGSGFTGTITQEEKITAPGTSSDCTESAPLIASAITAQEVQQLDPTGNQPPIGSGSVGGGPGTGASSGSGSSSGGGPTWAGNYTVQSGASFYDNGGSGTAPGGSESLSQSGASLTWNNFGSPSLGSGCTIFTTVTGSSTDLSGQYCNGYNISSGTASYSGGIISVTATGLDATNGSFSLSYSLR